MELVIQAEGQSSVSRKLNIADSFSIGRGAEADLQVPTDLQMSRIHAWVTVGQQGVIIKKEPLAKNPLIFLGETRNEICLSVGEQCIIGHTLISLRYSLQISDSPGASIVHEQTFSSVELLNLHFSDAEKRLEVLTQLPLLIQNASSNKELYQSVVQLLLAGLVEAEAVAIVHINSNGTHGLEAWDRRHDNEGVLHTSKTLIKEAVLEKCCTVLQIWSQQAVQDSRYTAAHGFDWAICTPIPSFSESESFGIYVAGRFPGEYIPNIHGITPTQSLQGDVKFTELVVQVLSAIQKMKHMEQQRAGLQQFFSPPILKAIGKDFDTSLLEPRLCHVTVLFCDLKGFSQQVEQYADDQLEILKRVSRALEVMTREILDNGGVIGDFHGDAAMGFWGWPFAQSSDVDDACQAALAIQRHFQQWTDQKDHPLKGFRVGIGIAQGLGVAGKIGTREHVKVTVFGPVVNLASRLEGMTKQLRVSIAIDDAVARKLIEASLKPVKIRKLAKILPYGIEHPVIVHELLQETNSLSMEQIAEYNHGVDQFILGQWEEAYQALHSMPANDRAADFLSQIIVEHNRIPPQNWGGIVNMKSK